MNPQGVYHLNTSEEYVEMRFRIQRVGSAEDQEIPLVTDDE